MSTIVAFVNTPTYVGGSEISILTLANSLSRDAFTPLVVTNGTGAFLDRVGRLGLKSATLDFPWFSRRRPWQYAGSILNLIVLLRREHVGIVHTNCDHGLPYVQKACAVLGLPYVSHVRDMVRGWFQPDRLRALNAASAVIVSSNAMAKDCVAAGIRCATVLTVYNPVDLDQFRPRDSQHRDLLRSELGIPATSPVVGLVGQVLPLKGHSEFLRASLQLAERVGSSHFVVIGQPPPGDQHQRYLTELRAEVARSPHAARFHFTGFRSDVPRLLPSIDILAVPSWREPFGRVAVEGMAAGCAVIASNVDGLPEIVTHDETGLLIPPKDPQALSLAMARLLADAGLRANLARVGRESAKRFSVSQHVEQIEAIYGRVLAQKPVGDLRTDFAGREGEQLPVRGQG